MASQVGSYFPRTSFGIFRDQGTREKVDHLYSPFGDVVARALLTSLRGG